ncbi:hypothetical protein LJX78_03430 [Methanimicrococcus blatticola]|uniref:hypothetical protein n=1 Tax=Methanimicrococcus blatticola TaxID=91560 RepID=UPI001E498EAD|nr:hypothetical protein [Methanimicrococcus blatticola]MCC2508663.1 hypothetical protein [Methanimicrococcus blatticola]
MNIFCVAFALLRASVLLRASALFYSSRSLRERGHCYLTISVLLLLPYRSRFTAATLPFPFCYCYPTVSILLLPAGTCRCARTAQFLQNQKKHPRHLQKQENHPRFLQKYETGL